MCPEVAWDVIHRERPAIAASKAVTDVNLVTNQAGAGPFHSACATNRTWIHKWRPQFPSGLLRYRTGQARPLAVINDDTESAAIRVADRVGGRTRDRCDPPLKHGAAGGIARDACAGT